MTNPLYDPYAVLQKVYGGGAFLKQALADTPMEELNRARTVKICYGVLENDLYLDFCIRSFAPKNPKLPVRILLKISLYLLLFLQKQKYMVTDNAVTLAKKLGKGGAAGFLNAFLRNFDAGKLNFPRDKAERLSVQYSVPLFAVKRILAQYGEEAESILSHAPARTFVRFASAQAAQKYAEGAEKTPFENLFSYARFRRDEGYDKGEYTFQSVGSVAICSVVEPCENLLDACAAPGGKSVLLSQKCKHVTAFELHEHRAQLICAYAERMGAEIKVVCRDSSVHEEKYDAAFDAVLVDAPCSGYGVIGENPDVKFFRKEESLAQLTKTQRAILAACAPYVRAGGALYYSTCSLFEEENDGTVGAFLAEHPQFAAQELSCPLAHERTKFGLQFLPHISLGAGFYVCKLKKGLTMKEIIQDLSAEEIAALVAEYGEQKYRAGQLYRGIMRGKRISDVSELSKPFKQKLLERFEDEPVRIREVLTSSDGTEKYLFELADGNIIEGVLMSYKYGRTQCISTQVGCRMGCAFCASGLNGLIRNLSAGEILAQILVVNARFGGTLEKRAVTNVVLMGSGEPLDNYDNVVKFLKNVTAEGGICISARNISLSTCGLVPKMYDLAEEGIPVNLTVSLHASSDEERERIMPVAKAYKIAEILKACDNYFDKTGRRYIFEYSLIAGENADKEHAARLVSLLRGRPCHVNLIRLNEVKERHLRGISEKEAYRFLGELEKGGLSATLRRRTGADIGGACGQLRASRLKEN